MKVAKILAAGLLVAAFAGHAHAATELKFAFPAPPQSLLNVWGFTPWAKEVTAASKGTLDIKIIPGPTLGNFATIYDRTAKGVADISFGIYASIGSRFPKTDVASIPFEVENPTEGAVALWRLFAKGIISDEYKDVHVLTLFCFGNPSIHTKDKEIKSLADVKGMKLAVGSKMNGDIVALLGGAPLVLNAGEVYQGLQRGVAEGALYQWTAVQTFKLFELTNDHYELPVGSAAGFVVMNKDAYAKLPAAGKAAIDKLSGEAFARRMGDVLTRMDAGARAQVEKMPGHKFSTISAADRKTWAPKLQPVIDAWVKQTPNGAKVLAAFRKELAAARAGK